MTRLIILSTEEIQKLATNDEAISVITSRMTNTCFEEEKTIIMSEKYYDTHIRNKKPIFKDNLPENWQ